MRFLMMIKSDAKTEAGGMPDEKVLVEMGKFNEELVKAGAMLGGEGLHPSSKGFRLTNVGGKVTVTDGPFAEAKELVAGFWTIEAKSLAEAIEWAKRVPFGADGTTEGQIEVRQITEATDWPAEFFEGMTHEQAVEHQQSAEFGDGIAGAPPPKPIAPKKLRYFMAFKGDAKFEAGVLPTKEAFDQMGAIMGEAAASGTLLGGEGLQPSKKAARVYYSKGKRTVVDGPFAEAKELIAGYCIAQFDTKEEAIEFAKRGALMNGDSVSEVRQIFQESDFTPEIKAKVPEVFEAERKMRERINP